jgi:nucleoside 2-deoxyribosyltransferase
MVSLDDVAAGRSLVYIATRLYDYSEKMKAERVEQAVLVGLRRAMLDEGIQRVSSEPMTFVPFRDTAQDKISDPNKTRVIYEEDLKRLKSLFAIVGFLDGLSKDEGVCMEIGYAYGTAVPVLVVLTDFVRREFREVPGTEHFLDPVLQAMATRVISEYRIPDLQAPFLERLATGLERVYERIAEEMCLLAESHSCPTVVPSSESLFQVYIDFGGGHFEWERTLQEQLTEALTLRGISVRSSQRYGWVAKQSVASPSDVSAIDLGLKDITNAANAKVVVTCADGDEMSSGTAAIQGLARALSKKVLLYDSKATYLVGDGGYRMSHNLMIDYSADEAVRKFKDLPTAIERWLST